MVAFVGEQGFLLSGFSSTKSLGVNSSLGIILSKEGQAVISQGYIAVDESAPAYSGGKPAGKIVMGGSSSVTPVMERLKEAYIAVNPGAAIEIQQSDSSAGLKDAVNGICEIAMSSRELRDSELEQLSPIQIALDGIAVIVNNQNPTSNLTQEQVKAIFTGETTRWDGLSR
jgi:phosphate transport system substrate-binding protein